MGYDTGPSDGSFQVGNKECTGLVNGSQPVEVNICLIDNIDSCLFYWNLRRSFNIMYLTSVMVRNAGMLPLRSIIACNLIAPLVLRNFAQGNKDNVKSMVEVSSAYTALSTAIAKSV